MKSNYGVIITQQGVDVDNAADYQRVLDSRTLAMEIILEQEIAISISLVGGQKVSLLVAEHNLGFLPGFEFFQDMSVVSNSNVNFGNPTASLSADTRKIFVALSLPSGEPAETYLLRGKLLVYNLPITRSFDAPAQAPSPATTSARSDFGAKAVSRERFGARMSDKTIHSFTLNTEAKVLLVHKTGVSYQESPPIRDVEIGGRLTRVERLIRHDLGYLPTFMTASLSQDENTIDPMRTYSSVFAMADGQVLGFVGVQSVMGTAKIAYVILKDPVELIK